MTTQKDRLLRNLRDLKTVGEALPSHCVFAHTEIQNPNGKRISIYGHDLIEIAHRCIEVLECFPIPGDLNPKELQHEPV